MDNIAFKERLAELICTEKPFSWAKRLGISAATFNRMWNDGIPPKASVLILIAKNTGVSLDWLLLGDGVKLRSDKYRITESPCRDQTRRDDNELNEINNLLNNELSKAKTSVLRILQSKMELKKRIEEFIYD